MRWFPSLTRHRSSPAWRRKLPAGKRCRRLLAEQLEDRRVLAQAVDDFYSVAQNQSLEVNGYGTWSNDTYTSSWQETYCASTTVWHDGYWENPVWHDGYYDEQDQWHDGYYDPPEPVWHNPYLECVNDQWATSTHHAESHIATHPAHGDFTLIDTGYHWNEGSSSGQYGLAFTYAPDPGWVGTDTFTYDLYDEQGWSRATVSLAVYAVIVPSNDAYTTDWNTSLVVSAAEGLLANDLNGAASPMSVSLAMSPAHGSLALQSDGSFTYTPRTGA